MSTMVMVNIAHEEMINRLKNATNWYDLCNLMELVVSDAKKAARAARRSAGEAHNAAERAHREISYAKRDALEILCDETIDINNALNWISNIATASEMALIASEWAMWAADESGLAEKFVDEVQDAADEILHPEDDFDIQDLKNILMCGIVALTKAQNAAINAASHARTAEQVYDDIVDGINA